MKRACLEVTLWQLEALKVSKLFHVKTFYLVSIVETFFPMEDADLRVKGYLSTVLKTYQHEHEHKHYLLTGMAAKKSVNKTKLIKNSKLQLFWAEVFVGVVSLD